MTTLEINGERGERECIRRGAALLYQESASAGRLEEQMQLAAEAERIVIDHRTVGRWVLPAHQRRQCPWGARSARLRPSVTCPRGARHAISSQAIDRRPSVRVPGRVGRRGRSDANVWRADSDCGALSHAPATAAFPAYFILNESSNGAEIFVVLPGSS